MFQVYVILIQISVNNTMSSPIKVQFYPQRFFLNVSSSTDDLSMTSIANQNVTHNFTKCYKDAARSKSEYLATLVWSFPAMTMPQSPFPLTVSRSHSSQFTICTHTSPSAWNLFRIWDWQSQTQLSTHFCGWTETPTKNTL